MEECMQDISLVESYTVQSVASGGGLQSTETSWSSAKAALTVQLSLEQEGSMYLHSIQFQYSVHSKFSVWTLCNSQSQREEIDTL